MSPSRERTRSLTVQYVLDGDWTEERRNYNQVQRALFVPPTVNLRVLVPRASVVTVPLPLNVTLQRARVPGRAGLYVEELWLLLTARARSIDAVVTANTFEGIPAWLLRPIGGYRWISDIWDTPHKHLVSYHASATTMRGRLRRLAARLKVALFRRALATSDLILVSACFEALGSYRLPAERVRIFANAIDSDRTTVTLERGRRERSVCFVSSLFLADRGLDTLGSAAERLAERGASIEVRVAGRLTDEARAASSNYDEHIRLLGALSANDAHDLMATSEVGVLPFHANDDLSHTQPIKLLEYMALGCVVVASDLPGVREVIRPGIDGLLVEPGDAEALAAALEDVFADGALRNRLRASAGERVKTFDARSKVGAIFAEIDGVCGP